ncbi:MAG TPA: prolipoprotein diacylglyceryl transferase [Gemmatimonadaceae bacterium]|nr:prolipoprotein diacylglyceryl transferase [Gemmatimonadaceae bacterium]
MTIPYPHIPPVIFHLGPFAVRWYGVMYIVGYAVGVRVARGRIARGLVAMTDQGLDTLVGYLVVGMLLGARTMYAIAYEPGHYGRDPLEFFRIWHGGLSFHGAIVGMTAACLLFARVHHVPFWQLADTLALAGTPGLFFGRLGNFINGELYGRPTHVPWAMVFPADPLGLPRHPSQLYEAVAEGLLLFVVLRALERRSVARGWYQPGLLAGAFLVGYGVIRILLEFTRQPDRQLGLVLGPFSMGQLLSSAMVVLGGALLAMLRWHQHPWTPSPGDPPRRPDDS